MPKYMNSTKDIVYFIKDTERNEELRYSLRSVESNFPYRKVWFFGGCPKGIEPDVHVPIKQDKGNKYMNVRNMISIALDTPELSDDFWLFNDDFFVMSKVSYVIPSVDGSLARKIQLLERRFGKGHKYSAKLRNTVLACKDLDVDRLNYEMHIPMLINKDKAKEVMYRFRNNTAFRSAYGNYYKLAKQIHPDVKVYDLTGGYDPDLHNVYLSTTDRSFDHGDIGKFIRESFKEPSQYEKDGG